MEINQPVIDKLAKLSSLQFSKEEQEVLQIELQKMLNFVNKLNELDTTGIEPLLHISNNSNNFREDIIEYQLQKENALKNAFLKDENFFKVPKVIRK